MGQVTPAYDAMARERFEALANQADPESGCLLWGGTTGNHGYGLFWYQGKMHLAHRIAWMLYRECIPEGLHIDHVKARGCRHKTCVRLDHLEPVTQAENNHRLQKEVCRHGHAFDGVKGDGKRYCKTCVYASNKVSRQRAAARRRAAREA